MGIMPPRLALETTATAGSPRQIMASVVWRLPGLWTLCGQWAMGRPSKTQAPLTQATLSLLGIVAQRWTMMTC